MNDLNVESRARSIAIRLLDSRDAKNIATLKRFLSFIPDPRYVKAILVAAVVHTCETSAETSCWLLQHPEFLLPEVNVTEIITQHLSQQLMSYGLISGEDFEFDMGGRLLVHSAKLNWLINEGVYPPNQVFQATLEILSLTQK